ncbi:XkdX family protein [Desulfosporosinus sp. SB140]
MDWVAICTDYYKDGYYNNDTLKVFVVKGKITADDYKTITGFDFVA